MKITIEGEDKKVLQIVKELTVRCKRDKLEIKEVNTKKKEVKK